MCIYRCVVGNLWIWRKLNVESKRKWKRRKGNKKRDFESLKREGNKCKIRSKVCIVDCWILI